MANEFKNKIAVVTGINNYEYVTPLKYARADAIDFANILGKSIGFDATTNILRITEDTEFPPSKTKISVLLGALKKKKQVGEDDLLLFFFSGHGMIGENGKDYLLPCDGTPDDLEQTAITVEHVAERLKDTGCKNIVMFIDACRDLGGKSVMSIGQEAQDAVKRAGIVTFFSCDPKKKSYEIDDLGHGSFTHCILEAIEKREGGSVSALDTYLRKRVREINALHKKPDQEPYAIIEPAEKGSLAIFLGAVQQAAASINDWVDTLADLYNNQKITEDLFNKTVEYLTTDEQAPPNFDRDQRTNLIKRLHEKALIPAAFVAAWAAFERKTTKPKPKTIL